MRLKSKDRKKRILYLKNIEEYYISSWTLFKGFFSLGLAGIILFPEIPQIYLTPLVLSLIYEIIAWNYDSKIKTR